MEKVTDEQYQASTGMEKVMHTEWWKE